MQFVPVFWYGLAFVMAALALLAFAMMDDDFGYLAMVAEFGCIERFIARLK